MTKDNTISFRTSKGLHSSLVQAAKEARRSLSSLLEMIIENYLRDKKALRSVEIERRRYRRKAFHVPAVINQTDLGRMAVGTVSDISLDGVGIIISRDLKYQTALNSQGSNFELVFNLPSGNHVLRIACESRRIVESDDGIHVGASFVNADFKAYQSLQEYLM